MSVTVEEQQLDREPPTVAIQAITWWEAVRALVKAQECGLAVHQPVHVCCDYTPQMYVYIMGKHLVVVYKKRVFYSLHSYICAHGAHYITTGTQ